MKHFFKGLRIGLGIGIPFIVVLLIFLQVNNSEESHEFPGDAVALDFPEEALRPEDAPVKPDIGFHADPEEETAIVSDVTLAFAGDVYFSEQYLAAYDKLGISALVDDEILSYMQNADLFMLNEEFAFSVRGEAMEDKQYTFRIDPKYVKIFQELGTDAAGIANNHILDFGQNAFMDTLETLKQADIDYVGGGLNLAEASAPVVRKINGQTFAIFAATRVSPSYDWYAADKRPGIFQTYDSKTLNDAISKADSQYDHTIVFVHWGIERNETPEEYQRSLARGYIDSGADLVIGCHPHVLQGFEYYKDVPIIYSLGNYLFGNQTAPTLLLNADFDENGKLTIRLIPCQRINGVLARIQEPKELFEHLTDLSFGISISEEGILIP